MLAQTGNVAAVERHLGKMLLSPEDSVEVCEAFTLGYCLNLSFDRAKDLIDAWEADHPDDYRPKFYRGQILTGKELWAEGEAAYRASLKHHPDNLRALLGLSECLLEQRKITEAEQCLDQVLAEEPDNLKALMRYASVKREAGDIEAAITMLERVLAVDEEHFPARLLLAKALLASGRAADASKQAQMLADEWPDDLAAVYTLAQALRAEVARMRPNVTSVTMLNSVMFWRNWNA